MSKAKAFIQVQEVETSKDGEKGEEVTQDKKNLNEMNCSRQMVTTQLTSTGPQTWYNSNPFGNGSGTAIAQIQLTHAATLHGRLLMFLND
jgi:hypothetical protein